MTRLSSSRRDLLLVPKDDLVSIDIHQHRPLSAEPPLQRKIDACQRTRFRLALSMPAGSDRRTILIQPQATGRGMNIKPDLAKPGLFRDRSEAGRLLAAK